jgi:general secretion pathway protein K
VCKKAFTSQNGIALILVLWVTILLTIIASSFAFMVRTEARALGNFKQETEAYYLARAGFERAVLELMKIRLLSGEDLALPEWRADGRAILVYSNGGHAEVRITDEGGKIDINRAGRDELLRVFTVFGLDKGDREVVVDSILDWRDKDHIHEVNGAEDDYYMSLPEPYGAGDSQFETVDELAWVRGVTPGILSGPPYNGYDDGYHETRGGLEDVFTVYSKSMKVNINTAPMTVLLSIPGISEYSAGRIIERREESEFRDFGDLGVIVNVLTEEFNNFITFSPASVYTIAAVGRLDGSPVKRSLKGVVRFHAEGYDVLYWKEG